MEQTDFEGENPHVKYGRLLEAFHLSGYGLGRALDELLWLLEDNRWKKVAGRKANVNDFLRSIDLSAFNLGEARPEIHQRIKELQPGASVRAIADMTGTPKSTVHDDLAVRNGTADPTENGETAAEDAADVQNRTPDPPDEDKTPTPPPKPSYPHSERLERWVKAVADQTHIIHIQLGGIGAMLAEGEKWDAGRVRELILPNLRDLADTIAQYIREIERHGYDEEGGEE